MLLMLVFAGAAFGSSRRLVVLLIVSEKELLQMGCPFFGSLKFLEPLEGHPQRKNHQAYPV